MNKIGIIASAAERADRCKWYEFIKKTKSEHFYCAQIDVEFIIVYDSQNIAKIFNRENVGVAVFADGCTPFDVDGVHIATGEQAYNRHIPVAIRKISKMHKGIDTQIAIIDDGFSAEAMVLLDKLQRDYRYITVITDATAKAYAVAEDMYSEYGVAISVIKKNDPMRCDIAVNFSQSGCKLPHSAIIFDRIGAHNISNSGRVINNFSAAPEIALPIAVNVLAATDALAVFGIENLPFKQVEHAGFRYDRKFVDI